MSLDYSKWDKIGDDDDDDGGGGGLASASPKDVAKELQRIQKEGGNDALQQLQDQMAAMKKVALAEKQRLAALEQKHRSSSSSSSAETETPAGKLKGTLHSQAEAMRAQLEKLELEKKKLADQEARVMQLAAAGDGASVLRFMEEQGLDRESIQRMLGGSDQDTQEVVKGHCDRQAPAASDDSFEKPLQVAEALHAVVTGTGPVPVSSGTQKKEQQPKGEEEKEGKEGRRGAPPGAPPQRGKAKKAAGTSAAVQQPEYSQRQVDGGMTIEVVVQLPALSSAKDVQLDVAPWDLRLSATASASAASSSSSSSSPSSSSGMVPTTYLLNFKLAQRVDPDGVKAKWLKKDKALRLRLPVAVL